jgi:hypothetical protein
MLARTQTNFASTVVYICTVYVGGEGVRNITYLLLTFIERNSENIKYLLQGVGFSSSPETSPVPGVDIGQNPEIFPNRGPGPY